MAHIGYYMDESFQLRPGGEILEQEKAAQILSDNLKNIFAYSLSRLYDKSEAEDLTNDIVCEVLKCAHQLRNEDAFYSFMWRIAENTFKKHIRKSNFKTMEFDESFVGTYWVTPEEEYLKSEERNLLHRELSLLAKRYRETTIAYYIYGKSCSQISTDLGISTEMVKYYLFKTRKILKEGIGMSREFGEKSYNPGTFRVDFWGNGDSSCYWQLFKRKLPGNILLSAYYAPVTIQELSIELGVAVVYLEDEIELLMKHDIIKKIGDKYQTNIIIFTDDYEKEVAAKIKPVYEKAAEQFNGKLSDLLPTLEALDFRRNGDSRNRLKWTFANLAMVFALKLSDAIVRKRFGDYPMLSNGSYGFVFGYDNDYQHHHFNGIYGHCENNDNTAYFSVQNYRIIEKCQFWEPVNWNQSVEAMCDAILEKTADPNNDMLIKLISEGFISSHDGKLSAEFPVFSSEMVDNTIWTILKPLAEEVCECMITVCDIAAQTLKNFVPKALIDQGAQLAFIYHQMEVMAFIIETMVEKNWLIIPHENEKLCVFGVKK